MKALQLRRYALGGYALVDVPPARIENEGEVLVKVTYVGVSFTDVIIALGLYDAQRKLRPLPAVFGFEFSGTVLESRSSSFVVGDMVCGVTQFGAFQEMVVVPDSYLVTVSSKESLLTAAAYPVAVLTALHAVSLCTMKPTTAAVFGASGGVGSQLVQLLARKGVRVTGVVGDMCKAQYVLKCGAAQVTTRDVFYKNQQTFDAIFLNDGTKTHKALEKVNARGTVVVYGFHDAVRTGFRKILGLLGYLFRSFVCVGALVSENKTVAGFNLVHLVDDHELIRARMRDVQTFMKENMMIVRERTLVELPAVLDELLTGNGTGKYVIDCGEWEYPVS